LVYVYSWRRRVACAFISTLVTLSPHLIYSTSSLRQTVGSFQACCDAGGAAPHVLITPSCNVSVRAQCGV
jgi:hypothetical protein